MTAYQTSYGKKSGGWVSWQISYLVVIKYRNSWGTYIHFVILSIDRPVYLPNLFDNYRIYLYKPLPLICSVLCHNLKKVECSWICIFNKVIPLYLKKISNLWKAWKSLCFTFLFERHVIEDRIPAWHLFSSILKRCCSTVFWVELFVMRSLLLF